MREREYMSSYKGLHAYGYTAVEAIINLLTLI